MFTCIAEIQNSAKVWVAYTEYALSQKTIDGEINTICDFRYGSSIPKKRKVLDLVDVYSIGALEITIYLQIL